MLEGRRLCVLCVQDVGICNSRVEKKVKYVFIEFATLRAATIVAPELVPTIHASHVGVVPNDGCWAWKADAGTISLASQDTPLFVGLTAC